MAEARQLSPLEEELARLGYLPPPQPDVAALNTAKDPNTALAAVQRFSQRDPLGKALRAEFFPEADLAPNERLMPGPLSPPGYPLQPGEMPVEEGVLGADGQLLKFKRRPLLPDVATFLGPKLRGAQVPSALSTAQEVGRAQGSPLAEEMGNAARGRRVRERASF